MIYKVKVNDLKILIHFFVEIGENIYLCRVIREVCKLGQLCCKSKT